MADGFSSRTGREPTKDDEKLKSLKLALSPMLTSALTSQTALIGKSKTDGQLYAQILLLTSDIFSCQYIWLVIRHILFKIIHYIQSVTKVLLEILPSCSCFF